MRKPLFTPEQVCGATALHATIDPVYVANWFAEGAVTRLSNALYDRLEAGLGPRYLRYGLASNCRCMGCHSWQIVELDASGGKNIVDETEDLMDWVHEQA